MGESALSFLIVSPLFYFIAQIPVPAAGTATTPPDSPVSTAAHFLSDPIVEYLLQLGTALAILLVGWWIAGRIRNGLKRIMTARHVDTTVSTFLSKLCYWLLIIIVVIEALEKAKLVDTSPLTGMLAASTLAVGLALQNSLSNFAAGVMIILFRHFRVGDSIEAGGVAGTVEEISIFDTHLITDDNRKIIVPNGKILSSHIINASAKPVRRLELVFNVSYESNLQIAKQIILASIQGDIRALPTPLPEVLVGHLGDNSVDLRTRVWVAIGDYDALRGHLLEDVKLRFDSAGIVIPYPQREVHLRPVKQTEK
jgi:small conductance mechanosensitive channel